MAPPAFPDLTTLPPGGQRVLLEQLIAASAMPERAAQRRKHALPALEPHLAQATPQSLAALVAVWSGSPAGSALLERQPALLRALVSDGELAQPLSAKRIDCALDGGDLSEDLWLCATNARDFVARLRRIRMALWLRTVARELGGLAPPEVSGKELALLAEKLTSALWQHLRAADEAARGPWAHSIGGPHGGFEVGLVLLGQGKIGARDLNVSSDIDVQVLALVCDAAGTEQPLGALGPRIDAFVQQLVAHLSQVTEDGWLYRVDLELRPFGRAGPLVQSLAAAEHYYESVGAPWERLALVRARPIAGDAHVATRFLERVQSFIYPQVRSAPFVQTIREQRRRATPSDEKSAAAGIDVKRARGGIRDIELFVQVHQVLLAGTRPRLKNAELLLAIAALEADGALMHAEASLLRRSYLFLRAIENTLQARDELQVHRLPQSEAGLDELCRVLQLRGRRSDCWAANGAALLRKVRRVLRHIARLIDRLDDAGSIRWGLRDVSPARTRLVQRAQSSDSGLAVPALGKLGFVAETLSVAQVQRLRNLFAKSRLVRAEREALVIHLLSELSATPAPNVGLAHLVQLMPALLQHSGYAQLLVDSPQLRRRLVDLLGTSAPLARLLVRHPELVDQLIERPTQTRHFGLLGRNDVQRELAARLEPIVKPALRWAALRSFVREQTLGAALGYLAHTLTPVATLRTLGRMTEATLDVALDLLEPPWAPPGEGIAVLALGRLGTGQRAFGSDIDLVFVSGTRDPERLAVQTLWLQKALAILGRDPEGAPIPIDLRLRPYGNEGPLITTTAGLLHYFRTSARLWERQAWLKARPVALDRRLGARTLTALEPALYDERLGPEQIDEARRVRQAMRRAAQAHNQKSEGLIDLKAGPGGLADIELGVQLLQLALGRRHPSLRVRGTYDALVALDALKLDERLAPRDVLETWTALRELELSHRIGEGGSTTALRLVGPEIVALARRMGYARPHPERRLARDLMRYRRTGAKYFASALTLAQRL